jgi:valyl-tRNA synthetase
LLIDYERASFTLDPIIQKQIREAFIKLYHDGLIYRGKRLVNWDPKLKSVISDIELEHRAVTSKLYYLKYPLLNSDEYLLVATSRPETIFVDIALFVNPHDQRYQKYLGRQIKHPWTEKIIPILTDESIKIDFGTGVLKCTSGHDFRDYELAKKYRLPIISCCDEKGLLNESSGHYQGQEISSIREVLVTELIEKDICVKSENYETNLAYSSKSGELIEPLLSQQ